ncbi:MAG: RND transporter, partial [Polyangiaceae bacterium]
MIKKIVYRIVDVAGRFPFIVLLVALGTIAGTWTYASHLDLRSDFLELLPRDSQGFKAFEHQLGRVGGGATLLVVVESPDRAANEKFIDDLSVKVNGAIETRKNCITACKDDGNCKNTCGPDLIAYAETGTKDVRKFFQDNKWLYADTKDLEAADETLDHQIAIGSGLVSDLEGDDPDDAPAPKVAPKVAPAPNGPGKLPPAGAAPAPPPNPEKKAALGMDEYRERWKDKANKHDDFPTGYFATPDGKMLGIRIISTTSGMGDRSGDLLLNQVKAMVGGLDIASYHPQMTYGFAGDIPNAIEEKDSLISDAAWATGIAFILILGGVVFFFRSPWSLAVISLPAFIGVGCAYS